MIRKQSEMLNLRSIDYDELGSPQIGTTFTILSILYSN